MKIVSEQTKQKLFIHKHTNILVIMVSAKAISFFFIIYVSFVLFTFTAVCSLSDVRAEDGIVIGSMSEDPETIFARFYREKNSFKLFIPSKNPSNKAMINRSNDSAISISEMCVTYGSEIQKLGKKKKKDSILELVKIILILTLFFIISFLYIGDSYRKVNKNMRKKGKKIADGKIRWIYYWQ